MRILIILLSFLFPLFLSAQSISSDKAFLNFGEGLETEVDSLSLTLTNSIDTTLTVQELRFYTYLESQDFWSNESSFSLNVGASKTIWVYFQPTQNVSYNSELLVVTDGNRGDLSINLRGVGKYSKPAYARIANLHQEALKTELQAMMSENQLTLTYNGARDKMYMELDNQAVNGQGASVNTLTCVYTGTTITNFSSRTQAQGMGFNTEHTFPQGLFSQSLPMRSDVHHLFPTTNSSNSERGNLPFGMVSNASWQVGGSKKGNTLFEPRDVHKGQVARAMLYFVLRYQNYGNFLTSQEAILRQWHATYPPTAIDQRRNDEIEGLQGNRNVLVDYPQLLARISSVSGTATEPTLWGLDYAIDTVDYGTVASQTPVVFDLPFVNEGNQAIQFSELVLNHPDLSFVGTSGDNGTLQPGEARTLRIQLNASTGGPFSSSLDLQTDVPGNMQVTIPIFAEISGANSLPNSLLEQVWVYPQPAHGQFYIENHSSQHRLSWKLSTLQGRVVQKGVAHTRWEVVNVDSLPAGIYLLRLQTDEAKGDMKLWVK